ncbi:MAG: hypothetical protein P1P85_03130 [Patescibacteria group bacterium]|nr:hypothetical protein [Patescibacteria group bacterium]
MNKNIKNILSIAMITMLMVSTIPFPVFADIEQESSETVYSEDFFQINTKFGYPIGVHILSPSNMNSKKLMVLVSGTGLDFKTNFFTPEDQNLALFYIQQGYTVVGIDNAETLIDFDPATDYAFMDNWGIDSHVANTKTAVKFAQKQTGIKDYEITGHSLGSIVALLYSEKYNDDERLKAIYLLEIGQFNPETEAERIQMAIESSIAAENAIEAGSYVDFELLGFAQITLNAIIFPTGDSKIPSPYGGNFTNEEFVYFAAIYTNMLPGNWQFNQGLFAGNLFSGLYYTSSDVLYQVGLNGGIYPMAIERDLYLWLAGKYKINFKSVKVPVVIVNAEGGLGNKGEYIFNKLKSAGNEDVQYILVPGGHADIIYGGEYAQEIWKCLK